jgi:hypothetical protein
MLLQGEASNSALAAYSAGGMTLNPDSTAGFSPPTLVEGASSMTPEAMAIQEKTIINLLVVLFRAAAETDLADPAGAGVAQLVEDVCRHFALLFITCGQPGASGQGLLTTRVFLDALEEAVLAERKELSDVALRGLHVFIDAMITLAGDAEKASKYAVFADLAERFMHGCYRRDWFCKRGGCVAIRALASKLSVAWCISYELQFLRGTITAPSLHHHCTVTAPSLHRHCTITAPSLYHHCTSRAIVRVQRSGARDHHPHH